MTTYTVSTHVPAPAERVFEVYTELDKAVERIPGIVSLELLSDGPFGMGTRWRETRVVFKKEATEEMWVTGFDPPRSYTVEAESHGSHYTTLFSFEPDEDGTKVTWAFTGTPLTFGAKVLSVIFSRPMKGMMVKCMTEDLEALRDACVAGEEPASAPESGEE